ncbi:MAG: hypothetical protein IJD82_00805, partial [Clostridia bacterium]|nr:hypothetical protein [Clostridia bacterium]
LGYGMLNPDGSVASGSSGSPIFAIGDINDAAPIAIYESILKYTAPQEIRVGEAIYLLQSEETQQKNIRDETLGSDGNYSSLALNVITFTYIQKKVAVIYRAVCKANVPLGFGEVSINQELVSSVDGIGGSNAMAGSGYRFIGWYKDEACADSDMVPAEWVYDPNPADDDLAKTHLKPQTLNTLLDEVVYYALFEPIYGGIEITKSGVETQDAVDHHFLFRVKGKDTNNQHIDLIVSVLGNGTVSIENVPIGDYNVTELTDWSWDYECEDDTNEVVVTEDQVSKTEFSNQTKNSNWLSGEAENENVFD